jgi:dipeptidyl aminopeptidase/acylaminoacyl peptidase
MNYKILPLIFFSLSYAGSASAETSSTGAQIVHFQSGGHELGGEMFKPAGDGPFPVVLYNHGSAPGMFNSQASQAIGPLFASKGWIFFMPYRRGQGLSADAGPYILDEIKAARGRGGVREASATMTRLLSTEQLEDQLSALAWLQSQNFVQPKRIAAAGNSFGGVETVLGAAKVPYCAAVVASGGAESWDESPELQEVMKAAARAADSPMLFFQAANDFNLAPSEVLSSERKSVGKNVEVKTYPAFGKSAAEGHSFAYRGSAIWFSEVFNFIDKHCI